LFTMPRGQNCYMSDRVSITIDNGIADVRLTRADKRNALDSEMFRAIAAAGERLKTQAGVRCVVLSGEGKSFCAGLDMGSMNQLAGAPPANGEEQTNAGDINDGSITHLAQQICWVWQELPMPVISAVHGHALGGGIQLALGTDIRFVHPETKMSVRETYWGLVPDMTGTFMLGKLLRPDIAKELTFTARVFSGAEAHEMGLVTHLTETPYDDAMALAAEIAGISPSAVRASKQLINNMAVDGAAEQFAEERRLIKTQIGTPNQIESVMASFENRSPEFVDA
jgi:enoyl-CoA hydratase/carnithine racemase